MDKRLISTDPLSGISLFHSYNNLTDETTLTYEGDAGPVLEINKKLTNETDYTKQGIKQEWWHYASIPTIVQMKWLTEYGIDVYKKEHGDRVSKLLEDPQWRYLKVTGKKHIIKP